MQLSSRSEKLTRYGLPLFGGVVVTSAFIEQPANAQSVGVQNVSDTVTSVGTVNAIAIPIVLVAMGVRLAIKLVNRLSVKG